jgi:hypothetical protein
MSAALEEDPWGNRWLSKLRATNRIDAAVASRWLWAPRALANDPSGSVYEEHGIRFFG